MRKELPAICLLFFVVLCISYSCRHKAFPAPVVAENSYPDSIAAIFTTRCATTGCHDASGAINAANLRMDSWDNLFKGSSGGAVVIPFSTDYSSLLYFINTDASKGVVAGPTMPYNSTPLSSQEYNTVKNWIARGAPDKNGNIPFASAPDTRQKMYITQQGCDLIAVVDAASKLIMRYIPIGMSAITEAPHAVRITADGSYAYVAFATGHYVQKIDTRTDIVTASLNLASGEGGIVSISPNGQKVLVSDFNQSHLYLADFMAMQFTPVDYGLLTSPHGIAATPNWDTFFVTAQNGNVIYRCVPGKVPPVMLIPLDTTKPLNDKTGSTYSDPHEIIMTPDHSKLFVTCQYSNEVRVLDAHTYKVLAVFPVGTYPQEFAISTSRHLIFVTCMQDAANPNAGALGSVYSIDYNTLQKAGSPIYGDFYQPHGITVDEKNNTLYIVSSNASATGPPPHHAVKCGDRIGWYSIYNLNTLQPINKTRYELSNDPYSAATRFP